MPEEHTTRTRVGSSPRFRQRHVLPSPSERSAPCRVLCLCADPRGPNQEQFMCLYIDSASSRTPMLGQIRGRQVIMHADALYAELDFGIVRVRFST